MPETAAGLSQSRVALTGLPASVFQHPLDKSATDNLRRIIGFDKLVSLFLEYGFERLQYFHNMSGSIRVSERQMPKLLSMLRECCRVLDVQEPELYVQQGGIEAFTFGHANPYIVLFSGLLDVMADDELMAVIAHELGHIKCGHVLYKQMARGITPFLDMVGKATLGIGALVGMGVETALLVWDRRSELSADRAALLVIQDARPCNTMLMKLAGGSIRFGQELNLEEFLNQARKYREDADEETKIDRFYRFVACWRENHPFPVERCHALLEWEGSADYSRILAGEYKPASTIAQPDDLPRCLNCNSMARANANFCWKCGAALSAAKA